MQTTLSQAAPRFGQAQMLVKHIRNDELNNYFNALNGFRKEAGRDVIFPSYRLYSQPIAIHSAIIRPLKGDLYHPHPETSDVLITPTTRRPFTVKRLFDEIRQVCQSYSKTNEVLENPKTRNKNRPILFTTNEGVGWVKDTLSSKDSSHPVLYHRLNAQSVRRYSTTFDPRTVKQQ
jgi:hypothetical protein